MAARILILIWWWLMERNERALLPGVLIVALAGFSGQGTAYADCASAASSAVETAYEQGRRHEQAGDRQRALDADLRTDELDCGSAVAVDAARRAARLGRSFALAAEAAGDFERAFARYEQVGDFTAADRMLMKLVGSRADDIALYDRAVRRFSARSVPASASSGHTRLDVKESYAVDPRLVQALADLPAKRAAAALARESRAFDQAYLRAVVDLERTRPWDPMDWVAVNATIAARMRLARQWSDDPLATSRAELRKARDWAARDPDASRGRGFATRVALRFADRANLLVRSYSAAPALLDAAIRYYEDSTRDVANVASDVRQVRALAARLGDQAARAEHHLVAMEYYEVAGDGARAALVRQRMSASVQATHARVSADLQRQATMLAQAR
jgi:hypothetical protein